MPRLTHEGSNCVLIVDHSDDNREVLRTALERRGLNTLEASGFEQGLQLARLHHPQVIVLDMETEVRDDELACQFDVEARRHDSSLVILGSAAVQSRGLHQRILVKPYHYAPLIRTIEQLISR